MKLNCILFSICLIFSVSVLGQDAVQPLDKEAAYTRTITTRAEKIVATLGVTDPSQEKKLVSIIADQYRNLNAIYTERDEQTKAVKQKEQSKDAAESELKKIEQATNQKIAALHTTFLSSLSSILSAEQVIKVKDGMTYNVVTVTYDAYVDMIPTLKNEQKQQIMAWLVEAREYAMDAESSEKKHSWFGKYKGRINNYLSKEGFDINEERKEWEKRKATAKQSTTN